MMTDLVGQLEHSYETRTGYWKGGTVSVFGYGGGIIPQFSEVAEEYSDSSEFHTLRVQPPAGMHYSTDLLRTMCDIWSEHGSGLIALHVRTDDWDEEAAKWFERKAVKKAAKAAAIAAE